jgi:hypothetical protein
MKHKSRCTKQRKHPKTREEGEKRSRELFAKHSSLKH